MRKLSILGLICLFIFAYCESPADPEIEKALNPGNPTLPVISYFTASPTQILFGESSTLSWSVENATTITIDHGIGAVAEQGTTEVSPEEAAIYVLVASTGSDSARASVQVIVLMGANVTYNGNLELTSGHDGYFFPPIVEGYVHTEGRLWNTGDMAAVNIVLHVPLLDDYGNEFYHLEYPFVDLCLEVGGEGWVDYTWILSLEIYFQIGYALTHDAMYVTWDEEN